METSQVASCRVGIVTVSYQSEREIREMIEALGADRPGMDLRIVVVSNSGDCQALASLPGVEVIQSGGNVGFGRACNIGVRHLDTELILFCNPDIRVNAQTIGAIAKLLIDHPAYGMIAPYCGNVPEQCNPTGLIHDYPDRNVGACVMMRRSEFNRLGGFDEAFFMWFEDTDLRDRVLASGLKVGFADGIIASHSGGHSYSAVDLQTRQFLTRAWLSAHVHYRLKHRGMPSTLLWVLGMSAINLARALFRKTVPGREYVVPRECVCFGMRLLWNVRRLGEFVVFDGQRFALQSRASVQVGSSC